MSVEVFLSILFRSFIIIFLGTVFFTGIFFIYRARQKKISNFYYIGFAWFLFAFGQILNQVLRIPVEFYTIFTKFGFFLAIPFTNFTFYKDRKTILPKIVFIVSIVLTIVTWYFDSMRYNSEMTYLLSRIFDFIHFSVIVNWMSYSCFLAYKNLKKLEIAPWIKVRYKLIYTSSPLFSLVYLLLIFHPFNQKFGDISTPQSFLIYSLISILTLFYGILFVLAWLMPRKLKDYLNNKENYVEIEEDEYSEEDLVDLIKNELDRGERDRDN